MSLLFSHDQQSTGFSLNKVCKLKNKNREGHKRITLKVREIKSPDVRSPSLRKKSAQRLFKSAHLIPS